MEITLAQRDRALQYCPKKPTQRSGFYRYQTAFLNEAAVAVYSAKLVLKQGHLIALLGLLQLASFRLRFDNNNSK